MTPRSKLRLLDTKRARVLAHAELKRLVRNARTDAELSQDEVGERVGISGAQVALRENVESNRNWTGADLLKLFEVLPGLREACEVRTPAPASHSLEAAVALLVVHAARLNSDACEAKADDLVMPGEAEGLRKLIVQAKRALAMVEAALAGEAVQ